MNEINEILEYAKAKKIAEKELKAERWVVISIILKNTPFFLLLCLHGRNVTRNHL